jgi:SAM-dependent methyltransferase
MAFRRNMLRVVNTLLNPLGVELCGRGELARLRALISPPQAQHSLPPSAAEYLRPDNPRLRELEQRYRKLPAEVIDHTLWSGEYAEREVDLQRFRGDNAFVYQLRDNNSEANHILTADYLAEIDRLNLFGRLTEDDLFGVCGFHGRNGERITRDLLDSIAEINFLESTLEISTRPEFRILDIGAGYGRFAHRLFEAYPNATVRATDALPLSTFLCEFYLQFRGCEPRAAAVPADELPDERFDLATNIHSFSECSLNTICWWLDRLAEREVQHLMVVPNSEDHGGARLVSREKDGRSLDFLPELEKRGYRLQHERPKYGDELMQRIGVSPSVHYLFGR